MLESWPYPLFFRTGIRIRTVVPCVVIQQCVACLEIQWHVCWAVLRLNVCDPPLLCWNPDPQRRWCREVGPLGGAQVTRMETSRMGFVSHTRGSRVSPRPFLHVRTRWRGGTAMSQDGDPSEGGCADPLVRGFQPPEPDAFLLFTSHVVGGILLQLPRRAQATLKGTRWQDQGASGHCLRTALASPPWRQSAFPPSSDGVPLSRAYSQACVPCPWHRTSCRRDCAVLLGGRSYTPLCCRPQNSLLLLHACMCVLSQHIQEPGKDTVAPGAEGLRHQRDTPASNSVLVKAEKCWKLWLQGSLSFPRMVCTDSSKYAHTEVT